ncbi:MAG TPA: hypothetical protein VMZ28_22770 [Kofleriaceae bacterium]|nr:hypothetical protein [Kofleriaceae bacterium]
MRGRWLAILVAAGIFGAGAAAGVAADRLLSDSHAAHEPGHRRPPRGPDDLLERYRERLGLDAAQSAAVSEVLHARFAEADAVREKANADIRALLRPDQLPRFEEIVREQEERRAERHRPPPPR